jgi:phenol 2-monooxygenase
VERRADKLVHSSWTRRQLGFSMEGGQIDYIWGVLDVIPITNSPDIRLRCAIHSADSGSVMIIPRETSSCVSTSNSMRSIELATTWIVHTLLLRSSIILKAAQKIMSPYKLAYDYCDWWTAYQIGQRVGNKFSLDYRVFLAGDAVHTLSQGGTGNECLYG